MGLFDSVKKFKDQNYESLKKESKGKGTLFVDPEFPPDDRSLSTTPEKFGRVVWRRPQVPCSNHLDWHWQLRWWAVSSEAVACAKETCVRETE